MTPALYLLGRFLPPGLLRGFGGPIIIPVFATCSLAYTCRIGKNRQLSNTACVEVSAFPPWSMSMADEGQLLEVVATAWSVYLATHCEVDAADGRRCLLERHLQRKWGNSRSDAEHLVCSGLAFLETPKDQW